MSEKILCRTPTAGKKPINMPADRFELVRRIILKLIPEHPEDISFKELVATVGSMLSEEQRRKVGSISWNVTTVKLELEVRGELERVPNSKTQRLRKPKP